jgi:uncharacterized Zn-finger protein
MDLKSLINPVEEYKPIFKLCKWRGCTERFMDDQTLFEHVNEQHIGRKKNDNLCLSCHWENCRVICSKRDHITSHLKVHIPIKPYKCSVFNFNVEMS